MSRSTDEQIDDGGPAFPWGEHGTRLGGITVRDYFAANAPTDEIQELQFRHLSRDAQEHLTGLKYPEEPANRQNHADRIAFQIAEFEFKCAVNAVIRLKLADAMLKARGES